MKPVMVITGAANGLGRELLAFYHHKFEIIAIDIDRIALSAIARNFSVTPLVCDITNYSDLEKKLNSILKNRKAIDYLINCAGLYLDGVLEKNSPDLISKVINVNLLGTINLCRYVVPLMKKSKSGLIINLISQAGLSYKANFAVYDASKWGVTGFTKALQLELFPHHVRVTGVYPGLLDTKFIKNAVEDRTEFPPINLTDMVKTIDFVVTQPSDITIPEIGIRRLRS